MNLYIIQRVPFMVVLMLTLMINFSCSDFLETTPKDQISDNSVWENTTNADLFLNGIYGVIPGPYNTFGPEENWSDDCMDAINAVTSRTLYANSVYTPSNAPSYWAHYNNIRKCNLFIEKVNTTSLDVAWKKKRLAEARFIRAYFYTLLWTRYGGVPVITDVLNQSEQGDAIFRPRNTSDATVAFIKKECAEIANDLPVKPEQTGRITRGAVLTLKGWCELFDASPLHNLGGDNAKWISAASTFKQVMDLKAYSLFNDYNTMFFEENNNNSESIFAKAYLGGTAMGGSREGIQGPVYVKGAQRSYGMLNPSQEIVDDYAMANGLPISNPASGYDPQKPYVNREQRFYKSIVYDGSVWMEDSIFTRQGIGSLNQLDLSGASGITKTGYYLRKGLNSKYAVNGQQQLNSASYMIFRYAEVLLGYAEAQNEAVGPDASVYIAINQVRQRSALPALTEGLTKSDMRKAIQRERRIELAFEEKRWYDLLRWKIAGVKLNGTLHGMKIERVNGKLTYTVIAAPGGGRTFYENKNYYLPIPQSAIDRNSELTQNPNY